MSRKVNAKNKKPGLAFFLSFNGEHQFINPISIQINYLKLKIFPTTGERFDWKNFEFEVVDLDGNRIDKLILTIKGEEES